jgi:acetyltransferase-like isoleucine patch superfamily enzyme
MSGEIKRGVGTYGVFEIYADTSNLYVGNYTSVGPEVLVYLGGNHKAKFVSQFPFFNLYGREEDRDWSSKGDVKIGSDVWIGRRTTIMSGITIGDGVTIAACSVVTRDIPPFALIAGNPARIKRYRFSPEVVERLMKLKWWNWEEDKIKRYSNLLNVDMSEEILKKLEEAD